MPKMKKFVEQATGKAGSIINLAMLFLVLIAVVVVAAGKIASINIKVATNDKSAKVALFHAESGADEAIARLLILGNDTNDPAAQKYDPAWRGFIGAAADATSAFSYSSANTKHHLLASALADLDYTVMIRKKLESDLPGGGLDKNADGDTNDVLVWEFATSTLKSKNNGDSVVTSCFIYIITSVATFNSTARQVEIEVLSQSDLEVSNGMYINGNLSFKSKAGGVYGDYNPACSDVPSIATTDNASAGNEASDWTGKSGGLPPENDVPVIDLASSAADLCSGAGVTTISASSEKNAAYGDASNNTGVYCTTGNYSVSGLTGYGILVVDGNFSEKGNSTWKGIIIVTGSADIGGSVSLYGALMSNGLSGSGSANVYYDCEIISEQLENSGLQSTYISRWQDF